MAEIERTEAEIREHYAEKGRSARKNVPGMELRYIPEFRNGHLTKVRVRRTIRSTGNGKDGVTETPSAP